MNRHRLEALSKHLPLTQAAASEVFSYAPDTGRLIWKLSTARRINVGDEAGTVRKNCRTGLTYRSVCVRYKHYRVHQIAWLISYGTIPPEIDHIDGDTLNNRLSNLRECTRSQNSANKKAYSTNSSGFKGVSFCKITGRWIAQITFEGKAKRIGRFDTAEKAHAAYVASATMLFGEFARVA